MQFTIFSVNVLHAHNDKGLNFESQGWHDWLVDVLVLFYHLRLLRTNWVKNLRVWREILYDIKPWSSRRLFLDCTQLRWQGRQSNVITENITSSFVIYPVVAGGRMSVFLAVLLNSDCWFVAPATLSEALVYIEYRSLLPSADLNSSAMAPFKDNNTFVR